MNDGTLQLVGEHIEQNPKSQMIIGGYISVAEDSGRRKLTLPKALPKKPADKVKAYLIDKKLSLANGATVMHKSIFTNGLYPEKFRSSEDLPVFSQALANNVCSNLNEPLAIIYGHKTSLRHNTTLSGQVGMQLVDEIFNSGRLPKEMHVLYPSFKSQRALSLFRRFYSADLKEQAKSMYLLAIKEQWTSIFKLSYTRKAFRLFICE